MRPHSLRSAKAGTASAPGPIPIKFGSWHACCLRNVINMSNFCNKIFRGFRSTGGQNPRFPLTIVPHRYNSVILTLIS